MKNLFASLRIAVTATLILTGVVSVLYPAAVWAVAQTIFGDKANGSLVEKDGKVVGSVLLGQNFSAPQYFHSRPSGAGKGYDTAASSGTNFGPLSQKLLAATKQRVDDYRKINDLGPDIKVPADGVTSSASGLDPHISPRNAELQAKRVARERGVSLERVRELIKAHTDRRDFGLLGEARVNVLMLNLALDKGA